MHTAIALLFAAVVDTQAAASPPPYHPCVNAGEKASVVFLGRFVPSSDPKKDPERDYRATGFIILFDGVYYLVSARHVPAQLAEEFGDKFPLIAFTNDKNDKLAYLSLTELATTYRTHWVLSDTADVAILPFGVRPEFNLKVIPEDLFLTSDNIQELQDVFFISYQPGIQEPNRITPIARSGMVSVKNRDGSFYIDAFAFPGNSGSPVFVKPSVATFSQGGTRFEDPNRCKLVGIVGEFLPYQEVAVSLQTKRPRVVFEENTGLAKVWPVQAIREVMNTSDFQTQHKRIKAMP